MDEDQRLANSLSEKLEYGQNLQAALGEVVQKSLGLNAILAAAKAHELYSVKEVVAATEAGFQLRLDVPIDHLARAIEIFGAQGDQLRQAQTMASGGRCFNARAGKLDQAFVFAARAHELGDTLNSAELRAWYAMEAEPYYYKGLWDEAVKAAEEALPVAWEIREWTVVFFASAWLALACLKMGQPDKAWRVLDRVSNEAPARLHKASAFAIPYAQIARAQLHLTTGHHNEALSTVRQALEGAQRGAFRLEEVAAHRVLGQVHEAMGDRAEADAAFRRSLEVLDEIQCPPELAQTLLAYGRFRRGDNTQGDRALIERALRLFEEMKATGWIEEARAALAAASPV